METLLEEVIESISTYISPESFLNAIKKVAQERGLVLKTKSETKRESEPLSSIKNSIGDSENRTYQRELELCSDEQVTYRIQQQTEYEHIWGNGGHSSISSKLLEINEAVTTLIQSHYHNQWDTYSDDSEDHQGPIENYTRLFSQDSFARAIFEELKRLRK